MANIVMAAEDRAADLKGRLPAQARARFEALGQAAADAHVLLVAANEAAADARAAVRTLEMELERTSRATRRDVDIEESLKRRIAAARAELAHRQRLVAERESRWTPSAKLINHIIEALRDIPPGGLVDTALPDVKPRKNETPVDAVERLRLRVAEIARERAAVANAPVPADVAKVRARQHVDRLAAHGRPAVEDLLRPDASAFSWPLVLAQPGLLHARAGDHSFAAATPAPAIPDALSVMAWVAPEALLQKMFAEIEAVADDERALTDEARRARLAGLDAEALQVEREEEALIRQAEGQSVTIARRPTASALAVLSVAVAEPIEMPEAAARISC